MIQIVSESNLNSKEDLIMLLNDTTSTYPLGAIFFATLVIIIQCIFNNVSLHKIKT